MGLKGLRELGHGVALWLPGRRRARPVLRHATVHQNGVIESHYTLGRLDP